MEKMLEKNKFFDAHFHLSDCLEFQTDIDEFSLCGCTSCHNGKDFLMAELYKKNNPESLFISFGVHPQNPDKDLLPILENLLFENKINAVGECGFDFFTKEYKATFEDQKNVFESQLELAQKFNKSMVIHCRKANDVLFSYSKELKKLPAVLFHSFMGSLIEAESLLKRGINGYFSFGKQIFNNNKKVIQLVSELPLEKLLLETDAPFQTLKGEKFTDTKEIAKIYTEVFELRKESEKNFAGFCRQLESNFYEVYSFLR